MYLMNKFLITLMHLIEVYKYLNQDSSSSPFVINVEIDFFACLFFSIKFVSKLTHHWQQRWSPHSDSQTWKQKQYLHTNVGSLEYFVLWVPGHKKISFQTSCEARRSKQPGRRGRFSGPRKEQSPSYDVTAAKETLTTVVRVVDTAEQDVKLRADSAKGQIREEMGYECKAQF